MQKIYPFLILNLLSQIAYAQSITIDPNASTGLLDAKSTTKGILIPKMSTSQKLAIVNPVEGLMVYDTDAKQFSYCLSPSSGFPILVNCSWVNFGNVQVPSTGWILDGNDVRNTNAGNIGIGTPNPVQKLEVNGNIKAKGLFMPIKYIPKNVNYFVADGDYTILVDGEGACIFMEVTLPNAALNLGRILNFSMLNYINFCNKPNSISFKDHLGNLLTSISIYDNVSSYRNNMTLQSTGTTWVIISDNWVR
ncbi:hypothetical protein [Emticicia sp. SJ17W-69]|uniref:hypothetical protein n=1 Tax=Emticicia sp. SJ17W-69 TaxID=3421657 RepID=UPI003EB8A6A2